MTRVTNQDRVDALIKSFWKDGYLTLSRRFGTFLPEPKPMGEYSVDAVGKYKKKYAVGVVVKTEEFDDPKLISKIQYLASRYDRRSNAKVTLFIGVAKDDLVKMNLILKKIDPEFRKNMKVIVVPNGKIN